MLLLKSFLLAISKDVIILKSSKLKETMKSKFYCWDAP